MTDIKALIARGKSTFEGSIPRDRLAWELADALELTQAVVEAARNGRRLIGMMTNVSIAAGCKCIDDALAALDAPPEGEG